MDKLYTVSGAARVLKARPKDISDLFYLRELRDDKAPVLSGRRLIPASYLGEIRRVLEQHGRPVKTKQRGNAICLT